MNLTILFLSFICALFVCLNNAFAFQQSDQVSNLNDAIFSNTCTVDLKNAKYKSTNESTADRLYLKVDLHSCYQALSLKVHESYQSIDVDVLTKIDGVYKEGNLDLIAAKESTWQARSCKNEKFNSNCMYFYIYFLNKNKKNVDYLIKLGYL